MFLNIGKLHLKDAAKSHKSIVHSTCSIWLHHNILPIRHLARYSILYSAF